MVCRISVVLVLPDDCDDENVCLESLKFGIVISFMSDLYMACDLLGPYLSRQYSHKTGKGIIIMGQAKKKKLLTRCVSKQSARLYTRTLRLNSMKLYVQFGRLDKPAATAKAGT
ncbi:hypothetical protein AVEN_228292-1 [Araneus ventricosus]|uniref:Uncharacterized protein n=1 Tax=Araneus ventricosus TaxID=182803 RepID=A0A4Y2IIM7_ARAVE|nr:hypothetical protein AVEN_228292-1 [Araneus ventricosus]